MSSVFWIVGLLVAAAWAMLRGEVKPTGAANANTNPTLDDALPTLAERLTVNAPLHPNTPSAKPRAAAYETLLDLLDELRSRGIPDADVDKLGEQIAPLLLKRKAVST